MKLIRNSLGQALVAYWQQQLGPFLLQDSSSQRVRDEVGKLPGMLPPHMGSSGLQVLSVQPFLLRQSPQFMAHGCRLPLQGFSCQSSLLFKILSSVHNHQINSDLAQLLLRLDYNKYYTQAGGTLGR